MQNATLTKKRKLPKEIPNHITENKISDWKKIIEIILSHQRIIQQFAPKKYYTLF